MYNRIKKLSLKKLKIQEVVYISKITITTKIRIVQPVYLIYSTDDNNIINQDRSFFNKRNL